MLNKLITLLSLAVLSSVLSLSAFASAGGGYPLDHVDIDVNDKAALQRGVKTFVNYCMSCHGAKYSRYNRVGEDLELSDEQVINNLIFTTDEKGARTHPASLMKVAMSEDYAKEAFGVVPPDLSLIARIRGADWLYTYLRTFYKDDSRAIGINNAVFPNVGMPHVLGELQGMQQAIFETHVDESGRQRKTLSGFKKVTEGSMSTAEYDAMISDLVTFFVYVGEPAQLKRRAIGIYVILFLLVLLAVSYMLKKEYWKDVH
ncbi:MAG: cytochrome c1 [Gammaproteobacteria bacterium]|nr:cytochrome c1 [Gammaproteobacteria bacterium]